ncbi:MAG TPA: prolipoprotein diacylglyceryl transferase family protein, partial [Candidatus Dormibacteraeota bacterium]|nr:prolipoprotein diacylglyceryl transferase family protein [Candidatus Dormibacteraeota bacterium]
TLGQPGLVVHPEVAYEMILTLVLLGLLLPFHQRLKAWLPAGVLGLIYLGLYGLGRFFLSYLRTDPAVFAGLRQAQLASALMFAIAVVGIPILMRRQTGTVRDELVPEPVVEPPPAAVPEPEAAPAIIPESRPAASSDLGAVVAPRRPRAPRKPGTDGPPRAPRRRHPPEPPVPPEDLPG